LARRLVPRRAISAANTFEGVLHGGLSATAIQREHIEAMMVAQVARPGSSSGLRKALRTMMQHAHPTGYGERSRTGGEKPTGYGRASTRGSIRRRRSSRLGTRSSAGRDWHMRFDRETRVEFVAPIRSAQGHGGIGLGWCYWLLRYQRRSCSWPSPRLRWAAKGVNSPIDAVCDAVARCVGIRCGAISNEMKLSFQAARSIG
jgi:hypothetical protein